MNGAGRTYGFAFAAQLAFLEVDVSQIVFHRNSLERTLFGAFSATDAGSRASLAGYGAFVFIDAAYEHTARFRTFVPQLDNHFRAGFYASTATGTQLFIDFGQTRFGIDVNGSELAGSFAIAVSETTERTACFSAVQSRFDSAVRGTVVGVYFLAVGASAVAAYHGNFRRRFGNLHAEYAGNFSHDRRTAYGAEHAFERGGFHARSSEAAAARIAATAAVGSRKHFHHFFVARVFIDFEFLSDEVQYDSTYRTDTPQ